MTYTTENEEILRFEHAGLDCKLVKQNLGHWCGYVQRPEAVEPLRWRGEYDEKHDEVKEAEIEVWGGVTYGPDGNGWVGFDDAHARSLVNHRDAEAPMEAVRQETEAFAERICEHLPSDAEVVPDA
jgi:hypothetical protein